MLLNILIVVNVAKICVHAHLLLLKAIFHILFKSLKYLKESYTEEKQEFCPIISEDRIKRGPIPDTY